MYGHARLLLYIEKLEKLSVLQTYTPARSWYGYVKLLYFEHKKDYDEIGLLFEFPWLWEAEIWPTYIR